MADSDYTVRGESALTTVAFLVTPIGHMDNTITITGLKVTDPTATAIGRPAMIDDEIVRVDGVTENTVTISRGCADTIPAAHLAGAPVWFFDMEMGTDRREYLAGETISVKTLVHTPNSIPMTVASVPPRQVTFNQRFHRPYPPAEFKCKGDYWFTGTKTMPVGTTELVWTWNHRDRLLQADQLIDHNDADIGPEAGTTYTVRIYTTANVLVSTVTGITGKTWSYPRTTAMTDLPSGRGYVVICSVRDGLESLYSYRTDINWNTDNYFANVSLLLHMDGPDDSGEFIDSSPRPKTVIPYGDIILKTAQSKFGGSSAFSDGTDAYLSIQATSDLDLSTGDFTIEAWIYQTAYKSANKQIFNKDGQFGVSDPQYMLAINSSNYLLGFLGDGTGATYDGITFIGANQITLNQWHHVAMVVEGGACRAYLNGVLQWDSITVPMTEGGRPLLIGYQEGYSNTNCFPGYIDEVRITKGVARYSAPFTPPTTPHQDA